MANKHLVWAWVIKNCIAIVCWTALAVCFGKWWIAFFGCLFLSDLNIDEGGERKDGAEDG